jgi:hypothetical protein
MRTFLLLYTERPTRKIFAAQKPGLLIYASDEITVEDLQVFDQCIQLPPPHRLGETLSILRDLEFDELIAQTEYSLLPGAILASERNLRALTPEAAFLCTNKWLQRRSLEKFAVPIPSYRLVENKGDILHFAQTFPVVLKPVASTLGRLVVQVNSKDELDKYVQQMLHLLPRLIDVRRCSEFANLTMLDMDCDPFKQFLVEEYIDAPVQETDGLLFGDQLSLFGLTEQVLADQAPYFFIEAYILSQVFSEASLASTKGALKATKLSNAGFSIELRKDKVIEVNGRLGEDDGFPDLFRQALGEYPLIKWINGDRNVPKFSEFYALAYVNWYKGGVLRAIENRPKHCLDSRATDHLKKTDMKAALATSSMERIIVELVAKNGSKLNAPPHEEINPHLAYAIAGSANADQALAVAKEMLADVRFSFSEE